MDTFETFIQTRRKAVDTLLEQKLPSQEKRPQELHEAMRYAMFSGGKRLRPLLCFASAEVMGMSYTDVLMPAIAIEALHTYTLVHDDLPAMDNDDLRRGKPTVHKQFNEAIGILVGDALLTLSFEWLAESIPSAPYTTAQLIQELAQAAGSIGVVGGQVEDLATQTKKISPEDLSYIHFHKTAFLMRSPLRLGAMMAGASKAELEAITSFGEHIGLAYQLADDLMDGGAAVAVLGKEEIPLQIDQHVAGAKSELQKLSGDTTHLTQLAEFICKY